ncbi:MULTISPECIES: hypothetical protein [unclassified Coleofasciculus]|uniref:hypothetical protein n=1 Tax=Coleofasciculus sp. LEGE 07092 TaxID=2777969 RepID=UPI00188219EC|nr:hypothetical protein [Coleofasciculus sp. LEGE 07081]MBE9149869.1 hypothetical protein [Coleofasciculus sp. LEGE 07092]
MTSATSGKQITLTNLLKPRRGLSLYLIGKTNYTLTNLVEHLQLFSHDTINRYLRGEKLTP